MSRARAVVVAAIAWALGGCAPAGEPFGASAASGPQAPARDAQPVAAMHRARCGKCHRPPEPGSHPRAFFEEALARHQNRVHLSPEEWSAITDYLAAPDGSTARQTD